VLALGWYVSRFLRFYRFCRFAAMKGSTEQRRACPGLVCFALSALKY